MELRAVRIGRERACQVLAFPNNTTLSGIGVGADPGSPITAAVTNTQAEKIERFADLLVTTKLLDNKLAVLDGRSLSAGNCAQPASVGQMLDRTGEDYTLGNSVSFPRLPGAAPMTLPTSRDGSLV